jgi:azurin
MGISVRRRPNTPNRYTPSWKSNFMSNGMDVNGPCSAPLARRRFLFAILPPLTVLFGCGRRPKTEQQVVDLNIQSDGDFLAFQPDTLTCPTGALVRLKFHHAGKIISARHNWVLTNPAQLEALTKEALDDDGILPKDDPRVIAATPLCDKGETVTIQFVAPPPGDYPFLCSTHPEDMRGILHVTK